MCTQLKCQLAERKTPVTLRWRLHKPVKNSRPGVSFKSMIHAVNKRNKASQILVGTPPLKTSTVNMFVCSETNSETCTVLTTVIIVACENCGGIPSLLTISKNPHRCELRHGPSANLSKPHGWKKGIYKFKSNRSWQQADTYCAPPLCFDNVLQVGTQWLDHLTSCGMRRVCLNACVTVGVCLYDSERIRNG